MTAAVFALLLVAAAARRVEGSWFAPGALFAGYWSVWMVAARLMGSDYTIPAAGPWFITGATVAVLAGSFLGSGKSGGSAESGRASADVGEVRSGAVLHSVKSLSALGILGGASALAATLVIFQQSGLSLGQLATQNGLFQVGNTLAVQRYSGEEESLGIVSLLLGITYAGALAAPFMLVASRSTRPWAWPVVLFLPVVGALAFSVVTTARLPMLLAACFTLLSCVVAISMRLGTNVTLRAGRALAVLASAVALGVAFVLIAFIRIGPTSGSVQQDVLNGFREYAIGYVSSFAQWVDQPNLNSTRPAVPLAFGAATFGAAARQLGLDSTDSTDQSLSQAYSDSRQLGRDPGAFTNIYTAFRSVIVDFGAAGALLFLAVAGFVAARAQALVLNRPGPVSALLLVVVYAYFLNSNIQSIFWFTNVCFAIILAGVSLLWAFRRGGAGLPSAIANR